MSSILSSASTVAYFSFYQPPATSDGGDGGCEWRRMGKLLVSRPQCLTQSVKHVFKLGWTPQHTGQDFVGTG